MRSSGQPSRFAASEKVGGAGGARHSPGASARASADPAPNQNGSPEASATTRRPRWPSRTAKPSAKGAGQATVSAASLGKSARWRGGPITTTAAASASRLACDSPARPSWPTPTIVSH